ncbi:MAG: hypothetical protein QXO51_08410 [Halobacteria archaeon]
MAAIVRVDDRGRLLLPEAVRRRLGIRRGGNVVIVEKKNEVVVRKPNIFLENARKRPLRLGLTMERLKGMEDELYGEIR